MADTRNITDPAQLAAYKKARTTAIVFGVLALVFGNPIVPSAILFNLSSGSGADSKTAGLTAFFMGPFIGLIILAATMSLMSFFRKKAANIRKVADFAALGVPIPVTAGNVEEGLKSFAYSTGNQELARILALPKMKQIQDPELAKRYRLYIYLAFAGLGYWVFSWLGIPSLWNLTLSSVPFLLQLLQTVQSTGVFGLILAATMRYLAKQLRERYLQSLAHQFLPPKA